MSRTQKKRNCYQQCWSCIACGLPSFSGYFHLSFNWSVSNQRDWSGNRDLNLQTHNRSHHKGYIERTAYVIRNLLNFNSSNMSHITGLYVDIVLWCNTILSTAWAETSTWVISGYVCWVSIKTYYVALTTVPKESSDVILCNTSISG